MHRSSDPRISSLLPTVLLAAGLGVTVDAQTRSRPVEPAFARLSLVERGVDQAAGTAPWRRAVEGAPLRIGERLRTGPDALARLDLPWMSLTVSPLTTVGFPDDFLLSTVLESGRVVIEARGRESLKLVTKEAEVRGEGRAVVRREGRRTLVTCLAGRYFVAGVGATVTLPAGRCTVVGSGARPTTPDPAPDPPTGGLWPARDPVYVLPGDEVDLRWKASAPSHQIEILPEGSETVLMQRDVGAPPVRVQIPWSGAFRWRVASRDVRGVEGPPSAEGLICVELR